MALGDLSGSVAHLRHLRELGVRVTVDDFGSGFSSLSRLADMPVDIVKIDRRYIDVGTAPAGRLLHLMMQGAHAVGLTAVAQGVEHDAQLAALRALDCEAVQGFHIARPMPASRGRGVLPRPGARPVRRAAVAAVRHLGCSRRGSRASASGRSERLRPR